MNVASNVDVSNIVIKPQATTRWEIIAELVDLAVKNGSIKKENAESIERALVEREKSMSTGIGRGVAIPHCKTELMDNFLVLLAISEKGINFDSIDDMPAKIIILLVVPESKKAQHIKTLANMAKLMSNEGLKDSLVAAKSPEEALSILKQQAD